METFGVVYTITNRLNGKVYVGQTTQRPSKRWAAHRVLSAKRQWPIHRAIAKYGAASFDFVVVEKCPDRSSLDAAECRWIAELRSQKPRGYNVTDGGGGTTGYRFPPEACARLGDRMRGRPVKPETGRKISLAKSGVSQSAELVEKRISPLRGRKHSDEWRAKIAASHLGKKHSPEHRAKSAAARRGLKMSEPARLAISRPVIAGHTEFTSIKAAAQALGISPEQVTYRIKAGWAGYRGLRPSRSRKAPSRQQIDRQREVVSKPVLAGGVRFPSLTAAATHFGVTRPAIRWRIRAGHAGYALLESA